MPVSPALALSAAEEEEKSTEFIARLLARDYGYRSSAYEEVYEDVEDADDGKARKGKRRGGGGSDDDGDFVASEEDEYRPAGAAKRKPQAGMSDRWKALA